MVLRNGKESFQLSKANYVAAAVTTLAYIFHGEFLSSALGVSVKRSTKHKRWCIYTQKQKTLTQICQKLIGRRNSRNVVFAYGMGRFNASSRGYKPAPANNNQIIKTKKQINLNSFPLINSLPISTS
jgi:hypothetical protein